MSNLKGLLSGILSSASFGLIPLFTLPLMAQGMVFDSILFYRFLIAGIAIGIISCIRKQSFRIKRAEFPVLFVLSCLYVMSALFLFWGYNYLSSGVATTIHFLYPVFVAITMMFFFHERKTIFTILAIILAISGVALLSIGGQQTGINFFGIGIVLISAISYALYIICVNKSKVREMGGMKLTFYVLLIGALLFFIHAQMKGNFQAIPNSISAFNLCMLAIIPTVVSNLALVYAIKHIGSTLTAILGAMEPLTAVCTGILVFHEPITFSLAAGVMLIILAVSLIILSRPLETFVKRVFLLFYRKQF